MVTEVIKEEERKKKERKKEKKKERKKERKKLRKIERKNERLLEPISMCGKDAFSFIRKHFFLLCIIKLDFGCQKSYKTKKKNKTGQDLF